MICYYLHGDEPELRINHTLGLVRTDGTQTAVSSSSSTIKHYFSDVQMYLQVTDLYESIMIPHPTQYFTASMTRN